MMIEFEQAFNLVLKHTKVLNTEQVLVEDSVGRILKEDVYSKIEMPPFNKSAMDGYALKAGDIRDVPVKLRCIGFLQAGQIFAGKISRGECVKIMTGASLPQGADSVVMVEETKTQKEYVQINKSVNKGANICLQGEDIRRNQKVLLESTVISTASISLLATVGKRFVKLIKMPKVSVLNTGGEIVPLGRKLSLGQIYNSNGPQLLALLKNQGIRPDFLGIAKDTSGELKKAIKKGLKADMLLISGGVSMGDYDLVPGILKELGVKEIFHKVRMKPGKPLFFGIKSNTIVFGIPGNPVSNFLAYQVFIKPALLKMTGYKQCASLFKTGVITGDFRQKTGRKHFVPVKISLIDKTYYISTLSSHGSADIFTLSKADGFMVVEENADAIKANSIIPFITWKKI